jgi:hypothetical protein
LFVTGGGALLTLGKSRSTDSGTVRQGGDCRSNSLAFVVVTYTPRGEKLERSRMELSGEGQGC